MSAAAMRGEEVEMKLTFGRSLLGIGVAFCVLASSACDAATPIGAPLSLELEESNAATDEPAADGGALDPLLTPLSPATLSPAMLSSEVPDCVNNERISEKDAPQSLYLDNQRFGWA